MIMFWKVMKKIEDDESIYVAQLEKIENPKTLDSDLKYILLFGISITCIIFALFSRVKHS